MSITNNASHVYVFTYDADTVDLLNQKLADSGLGLNVQQGVKNQTQTLWMVQKDGIHPEWLANTISTIYKFFNEETQKA